MRCNNCGWDNPSTNTHCEKCNAPLSGGAQVQNSTSMESSYSPAGKFSSTVREDAVFGTVTTKTCPKCGYPLRDNSSFCPNCGAQLIEEENPKAQPQVNKKPAPQKNKTVNPYIQVQGKSKCTFELIPFSGETLDNKEVKFSSDSNVLTRDVLDPDNTTITSKTQAELTCENSEWFLQDKSSQKTTFIYVKDKLKLQDGDVVLMGNRQFLVHIE